MTLIQSTSVPTSVPAPVPALSFPGLAFPAPDPALRPAGRAAAEAAVHATLLRQSGVITRAQALAAGLSPDVVDRRLASRRWHPLHPRVYRDGAFPETAAVRVRAAVLWAGPGAVLGGTAAAWWHGLPVVPPAVVGVTVPRRRSPRPRPGVTVRRRGLDPADVRTVRGVAVTAPGLAALEAAVELGARGPGHLMEWIAAGRVGPDALYRAHARNLGANGSAAAGRVLGVATRGVLLRARRRLAALLAESGPPGWVRDRPVAGLPLELAFPRSRVALEVSFTTPGTPGSDDWRAAVLARHGWTVVAVRPSDVLARPDEVLDRIRRAVDPEPTGPAGDLLRPAC